MLTKCLKGGIKLFTPQNPLINENFSFLKLKIDIRQQKCWLTQFYRKSRTKWSQLICCFSDANVLFLENSKSKEAFGGPRIREIIWWAQKQQNWFEFWLNTVIATCKFMITCWESQHDTLVSRPTQNWRDWLVDQSLDRQVFLLFSTWEIGCGNFRTLKRRTTEMNVRGQTGAWGLLFWTSA